VSQSFQRTPADMAADAIVSECKDMSDDEIIEAYHYEYFDEKKPWIKRALTALRIDEHEVTTWIYINLK